MLRVFNKKLFCSILDPTTECVKKNTKVKISEKAGVNPLKWARTKAVMEIVAAT